MRKFRIFGTLAAAALLASCSSEDVVGTGNSAALKGDGYVSFAINLPTTRATRAANDKFDDGTANEYAVYDATLVLFEGTSEADATLSTAYNLNLNMNTTATANDNITSTAKVVQKINDPLGESNKFYALVVLNSNGQLVVDGSNNLTVNNVPVIGKTLSEFITVTKIDVTNIKLLNGDSKTATQFFMSNAPLFTATGGSTDPKDGATMTLPTIDGSKIYKTESEAVNNPAAEINVERAVAKVTLSTKGDKTTSVPEGHNEGLSYKVLGWQLNNTNKESYLVRNVSSFGDWKGLKSEYNGVTDPYRFVGSTAVQTGLYRTYWGVDPNYASATTGTTLKGDGMNYWNELTSNIKWYGSDDIAYCAENTFDVANQNDINSTTAILKVQFNDGETFYTVNKDEATFYYDTDDATAGKTSIKKYIKSQFLNNAAIKTALKSLIKDNESIGEEDITVTLSSDKPTKDDGSTPVAGTDYTTAGRVGVQKITIAGTHLASGSELDAEKLTIGSTNATAMMNKSNTIRRYDNGIAYYSVIIKHFGDDLTPWGGDNAPAGKAPTALNIYPENSAANYLGRYGVLRNNWYDISVTSIKNLGSATVPSLGNSRGTNPPGGPDGPTDPTDPEEPDHGGTDDNMDQYLSVKINVLSWAKRTQSVEL